MKVLLGRDELPRKRFTARLLWEPRDLWVGVFWNTVTDRVILHAYEDGLETEYPTYLLVYVSLIPCLPLCFAWRVS
jgi:hypothetical protein